MEERQPVYVIVIGNGRYLNQYQGRISSTTNYPDARTFTEEKADSVIQDLLYYNKYRNVNILKMRVN